MLQLISHRRKMLTNFRKRIFSILLVGFIGLTLYTYYRTTIDNYRIFLQSNNTSNIKLIHENKEYGKTLPRSFFLSKNITTVPSKSISNELVYKGPISTDGNSFSTSLRLQSSSSASTSNNSHQLINNTSLHKNISAQSKLINLTLTIDNNSMTVKNDNIVSTIYPRGHEVAVPEKCPNNGIDINLVIVIMSAPSHSELRMGIRQTWGHFSQRRDISILFIIGKTNNTFLEKSLKSEEELFTDIIRGNFIDSYSNLTLKTISILEWVDKYCSQAKFLLKTDDDMFINIPRLLSFAKKHEKDTNVIFGRVAKKWKPSRNKRSKYYVPQEQYNGKVFPDFTTGPAYLLSRDVINKLYNTALNVTYMKLEDVFITGIVANKLGIRRVNAEEFLNRKISYLPCSIQRGISIHMVKYGDQFDIWKKLLDGKSTCKS